MLNPNRLTPRRVIRGTHYNVPRNISYIRKSNDDDLTSSLGCLLIALIIICLLMW
jgi:hypothetical protein